MRTQVELGDVRHQLYLVGYIYRLKRARIKGGHVYGNISYSFFANYGTIRMNLVMYNTSNKGNEMLVYCRHESTLNVKIMKHK